MIEVASTDRRRACDEHLISSIVEAVIARTNLPHGAQCLSEQEQHWVRLAIIKQEQSIALRQAVIEKSLTALVWSTLVGVGYVFVDFLNKHGIK